MFYNCLFSLKKSAKKVNALNVQFIMFTDVEKVLLPCIFNRQNHIVQLVLQNWKYPYKYTWNLYSHEFIYITFVVT